MNSPNHLPSDASIEAGIAEVSDLTRAICAAFPIARREIERLTPPDSATPPSSFIDPPPLVKLTLAVAGAALSVPGVHYVNLYSREADLRPELYRMVFDRLNSEPHLGARILTRRTTGLQVAAAGVKLSDDAKSRVEIHTQTARAISPDLALRTTVSLLDLEQLHKEVRLSDVLRLHENNPKSTILLHGSREHPCLRSYFTALSHERNWIAWGVNREQILRIDADQNHRALHAIASTSPVKFDPDDLPERFHDLPVKSVVSSQYRASPQTSGRIWASLAGAYAIRDARRRSEARRDVLAVTEGLPKAFMSGRGELEQLTRIVRANPAPPFMVTRWLDDLWYLATFASRVTSPLHAYIRELQTQPYFQRSPLDLLRRIQAESAGSPQDTTVVASVQASAESLIAGYEELFERQKTQLPPRLSALTESLTRAIGEGQRVGIVALNAPDKVATEKTLKKWLTSSNHKSATPPPEGKTALEHAGIRVFEPRAIADQLECDVLIVPRYPSPTHLDQLVTLPNVVLQFLVPSEDYKRIVYDVCRDIVRERRVFSARVQAHALSRVLGKATTIPIALQGQPTIPAEIERIVDEMTAARERRAAAQEFDLDKALRELVEIEAVGAKTASVFASHAPDPVRRWQIVFDDGSTDEVDADDALQVLDLQSNEVDHMIPSELRGGMVVITTNDSASSSKFAAQIIATVSRVRPALASDIALDRFWRESLRDYRIWRGLSRNAFLERAKAAGFTNETALTLRWYEQRTTWRPLKKTNFEALMAMLEEDKPGIRSMADQAWTATNKLRSISRSVLSHVRDRAQARPQDFLTAPTEELDPDRVLVPELGLRVSHVDGLFLPKTILRIIPPAGVPQ